MSFFASQEKEKKVEGIVVKALDYQENKRIFTLFTPEGLLSLITTLTEKQPHRRLLSSLLSKGEYCFLDSSSPLKKVKDASLLSTYLNYKHSYEHLETASFFVRAIQRSQIEGKPAPILYQLLSLYLAKLPSIKDPYLLLSSFHLKVLQHEGLLSLGLNLSHEEENPIAKIFSKNEIKQLMVLTFAKQFSELELVDSSKQLHEKIKNLFDESFR